MLIAQNAANLLTLPWPQQLRTRIETTLLGLIRSLLADARTWWVQNTRAHGHAYFVGLGLEVLSQCADARLVPAPEILNSHGTYHPHTFSKAQIAGALFMSISTLDRRVAAGTLRLRKVSPHGWQIDVSDASVKARIDELENRRSIDRAQRNS